MLKNQIIKNNIEISQIISEVKKNGFYSSFCDDLVSGVVNLNELISVIEVIAARANLKVSFNATNNICIFEMQPNNVD